MASRNQSAHDLAALGDDLCEHVLRAHRAAQAAARGDNTALSRVFGHGVGDVTYALDAACEEAVERWAQGRAKTAPLSVLTEDRGWRHFAPGRTSVRELDDFDHGGPRIAVDPVDGTRNVMADLRAAWTVVSACQAGEREPRAADVVHGTLGELPLSSAARARRISASEGAGATIVQIDLLDLSRTSPAPLVVDGDARVDGYLPFFRYDVDVRRAAVEIETDFLDRLIAHENVDPRHLFDDQYICSAGQLVLLALGTYRMVCDPRVFLAERNQRRATTSKPYDVAGALVVAREAGCVVAPLCADALLDASGRVGEFDFALDASTPVGFVGFHNAATARRLAPHLLAALATAPSHP